MKILVLLFAALLVAGCGEKPRGESSADAAKQTAAEPPVAESPSEAPSESPNSLGDADVERLLKEAVDSESLPERDGLIYHDNKPYSGWGKQMYDSGQASRLAYIKDGRPHGLIIEWHENSQKALEGTYKDGELISAKYWNSKGEEVETREEAAE